MADPDAPNRTIQIDALSDVQLVDDAHDDAQDEAQGDVQVSAAPPPLPAQRAPQPSRGRAIGLTMVAVVLGVAFALGVVHFLFPAPTPPAPAVRQIRLDDELVIHAGD